jgi:hypothetical protein
MLTRKTKAHIKDLELQIDFLICYANQGLHWKREYHFRQDLIDRVLYDESTPPEVVQKINNILERIFMLKNKEVTEQPYMHYLDNITTKKHKIKVKDYLEDEPYYIEI